MIAVSWLAAHTAQRERGAIRDEGWWLLGVTVLALFVGRAGYVLENLAYFRENPEHILGLRRAAGIHGLGALVGGLAAVGLWAAVSHRRLWPLLGRLTPPALWIVAGAWWACQDVACVWGKSMPASAGAWRWLTVEAPDLTHMYEPRIAIHTLGIVWALGMAVLGWALGPHGFLVMPSYLAGSVGLTLLRGNPTVMVAGVRLDTLLHASLSIAAAAFAWSCLRLLRPESRPHIGMRQKPGA